MFNAANEVAVEAFLENRIGFSSISRTIERSLETMELREPNDLNDIFAADEEARRVATEVTHSQKPS